MPSLASTLEPEPHGRYIPQLDSLRAFAVISVMLLHFHPHPSAVLKFLGREGVRFFFVLSGFLITGILLSSRLRIRQEGQTIWQSLRIFYVRRFLRIFPPYYAILAVLAVLLVPNVTKYLAWHLTYTTNFLIARLEHWPTPVGHFWTLAVEEQFYVLWPLLLLLVPGRFLFLLVMATIATGLGFRIIAEVLGLNAFIWLLTPAALDALGMGALLALAGYSRQTKMALSIGSIAALSRLCIPKSALAYEVSETGLTCLYALIILLASTGKIRWFQNVLCAAPITFLGKISYGVYLYHVPVAWLFRGLVERGARHRILLGEEAYFILAYGFITIGIASMSWFFFERPILGLKNRFAYDVIATPIESNRGEVVR